MLVSRIVSSMFFFISAAVIAGCASMPGAPEVTPVSGAMPPDIKKPSVIYVTDFSLDPSSIERHELIKKEGLVKQVTGRFRHKDPQVTAEKLVSTLSQAIVDELNDSGQPANYVPGTRPEGCPSAGASGRAGWMVNGWFVAVDEGNRAVEATVGFGTGGEHVDIQLAVSECTSSRPGPFMVLGSGSGKNMRPGGIVTMNPYAIAVKYVLSKGATEKDVKKQGKAIARNLLEQIKAVK